MNQNRSMVVAAGVIGAVAIAVLCVFTLPFAKVSNNNGYSFEGSFSDLYHDSGAGTFKLFAWIAGAGAVTMVVVALTAADRTDLSADVAERRSRTQASFITVGALAALSLPVYTQYRLSDAVSQARDIGQSGASASIGTGLILASVAIIIGAIISWIAIWSPAAQSATPAAQSLPSFAVGLGRLDAMRRDGALTDAEFQTAKDKLLK